METEEKRRRTVFGKTKDVVRSTTPWKLMLFIQVLNLVSSLAMFTVSIEALFSIAGNGKEGFSLRLPVVSITGLLGSIFFGLVNISSSDKCVTFVSFLTGQLGFLYTHRGRAFFLIFMATLAYSTIDVTSTGGRITGTILLFHGIFCLFVYYVHPTIAEISLFPDQPDIEKQATSTISREQSKTRVDEGFTGVINNSFHSRNDFDSYQYAESPFAIEETDDEFTNFALQDNSSFTPEKEENDNGSKAKNEVALQ